MRRGAKPESWGEKCRRADIPEMEHGARSLRLAVPRHFEGGFCPRNPSAPSGRDPREIPHSADSVRNDGGLGDALVASASCKCFAKCRRADNSRKWKFMLGVTR